MIAIYASHARQTIRLYLDGVFTAEAVDSLTVVKDQHKLQAIHVVDPSVDVDAFVLSSSSNGIRTDTSWRCSNQYHEGWFLPNYNDTSWPRPYVDVQDTHFIAPDAKWIAYLLAKSNKIFCRRKTTKGNRILVHAIHLACGASVSVGFGSKERPRNGIFGVFPARKMGREPKNEAGKTPKIPFL